jgi:transcriptional regulator with XRE-family HTH domain
MDPNNDDDYTTIARAIKDQRRSLALTQTETADLAGIERRTLSQFESGAGTRGITLRNLLAVAEVLGLRIQVSVRPSKHDRALRQ